MIQSPDYKNMPKSGENKNKYYIFEKIKNNEKCDGLVVIAKNNNHCISKLTQQYFSKTIIEEIIEFIISLFKEFKEDEHLSANKKCELLHHREDEIIKLFQSCKDSNGWRLIILDDVI